MSDAGVEFISNNDLGRLSNLLKKAISPRGGDDNFYAQILYNSKNCPKVKGQIKIAPVDYAYIEYQEIDFHPDYETIIIQCHDRDGYGIRWRKI